MFDTVDLTERCRKAAGDDVSLVSDDDLLVAAVGFQAARTGLDAAEAHVLGEIQARAVTDRCFGLKTAPWVAKEANVDRRGVHRRLRVGMGLRRLGLVDAAVADGTISADHAAAFTAAAANPRVGDQVVAGQAVWLELAAVCPFARWHDQLQHTVAQLDEDGGYDPNRDLARNKLRLTPLPDRSLGLAGELTGEYALIGQLIEGHADRLFHRFTRDHDLCGELPIPTRSALLAMALAELVLRGSAVDLENSTGSATDVTMIINANPPDPDNRDCDCDCARNRHDGPDEDSDGGRNDGDRNRDRGGDGDDTAPAAPDDGDSEDLGPDRAPAPTPGDDARVSGPDKGDGAPDRDGDVGPDDSDGDRDGTPDRDAYDGDGDGGGGGGGEHAIEPDRPDQCDRSDRFDRFDRPDDGDPGRFDPYGLFDPHPTCVRSSHPPRASYASSGCGPTHRNRLTTTGMFGPATTPDGFNVAPEVASTLCCDPKIHTLVIDSLGVALDMGREIRYANRAQRRALAQRDGGCVFPGCDAPIGWCDAHHVIAWEDAGPTEMANLALLCRYHHGVTHRRGWTMTAHPDQTFTWTTPLGQTLPSQRHRGRSAAAHAG